MTRFAPSEDFQPIAWIGPYPVYVPTALVIIHFATMTLTAALAGMEKFGLLSQLVFSSSAVIDHLAFWQFGTYAFVNEPTFWFLIEMAMLYFFGREVEQFIGRRAFLALYAILLLLPPCILLAIGSFTPVSFHGSQILHFCLFIAFACLYPSAEVFFGIQARWIAAGLYVIYMLQMVASHSWVPLVVLWFSSSTVFFFIGRLRYGFELPNFFQMRAWLGPRGAAATKASLPLARRAPENKASNNLLVEVDSLLEKISKTGMGSLTETERNQLSQASKELKKRERATRS